MTFKKILQIVIFTCFAFFGCTSDSLSDLIAVESIEIVKYSQNIKQIIDNNCISCHGATPTNGAPNSLHTFELMKDAVLNGDLINRVSVAEGTPGAMPLGGPRLPQSDINKIIQWNTDGLIE
jgi:mono/diheme cytochrome c family protein